MGPADVLARGAAVALAGTLLAAGSASAASVDVASPGGDVVATVTVDQGRATLSARLDGRPVLAPSPLGLVTGDGALGVGVALGEVATSAVDERVRTVTGPRRIRRLRAAEARVPLGGGARPLVLRVRVTDAGVAYRYELPGPPTTILDEAGGFAPAGVTSSWLAPHTPNGESLWGGVSERDVFGRPGEFLPNALFRQGDGDRFVLLTEAGVNGRHAAARLVRSGALYRYAGARRGETTTLGPMESGDTVPVTGGPDWQGAWRVAIVGRLAQVATSTLVADLSSPPARDFGWVQPGIAAWSWWSEAASPRSLARQKQYVDFAAQRGWRYSTVDDGWEQLGEEGVRELAAYARERGVRLLLWFNQRSLDTPAERDARLDALVALGAAGAKIDFFDDETQQTMRLVDDLLRATADRRLVVNLHGITPPRGLERTWQNLLSYEGVRGAEYHHLAEQFLGLVPAPTPAHNTILAYTRAVAGPADYTPVTFTAPGRRTTPAHELALALVLHTGILHPADRVEAYAARPNATAVLDGLPVTWDESLLLEGFPGRGATVARRHGESWSVGSITAGAARQVSVRLGFLDTGRWRATIAEDGGGDDVALRVREVRSDDVLALPVRADGGFVVRLERVLPACRGTRRSVLLPRRIRRRGVVSVRVHVPGSKAVTVRARRGRVTVRLGPGPRSATTVRMVVRGRDGARRTFRRSFAACA